MKICIDPGHGPGNGNGSPDGRYSEQEFCLDMARRLSRLLTAAGADVLLTRTGEQYPGLQERARTANSAKADLFVSIHSNAYGDGEEWTSPRGFGAYTSAGPETAERNLLAAAILQRVREGGFTIHGSGRFYNRFTVLTETDMPAVLLECAFHTNEEDTALLEDGTWRQAMAEAIAKGVIDHGGLALAEPEERWYDAARAWAREKGLPDGTRPEEPATRAEVWEMLMRLSEGGTT